MKSTFALASLLALAVLCPAQESGIQKSVAGRMVANLTDGAVVPGIILDENITVTTRYEGLLVIPFADVRRIEFGIHFPDGKEKEITGWIGRLGDNNYRVRDKASKYLVGENRLSYSLIKKAKLKEVDTEKSHRMDDVLKEIESQHAAEFLARKDSDMIYTSKDGEDWKIVGRINGKAFRVSSITLGDLTLKFSELALVKSLGAAEQRIAVDAATHGSALDQWLETAISINAGEQLLITADGKVDLWPQGPNQYVAFPKGYNTAGKGGQFLAGALVGRIGETGKSFLIGERFDGAVAAEGRLYLQIIPSPWNNASSGRFNVRILRK